MGKQSPKPPEPIDPTKTIAAQSSANEATARLQQQLGMIGTYGPGGSVTYKSDPNSPAGYSQYTSLDPSQQAIYDKSNTAQIGALDTANTQIGRINTALGQSLTPPELQTSYDPGGAIQSRFDTGPGLKFGYDPGQDIQGQVGPTDFSADRNAVTDSEFQRYRSRLDPMWDQAQNKQDVKLANQGLSANSTAAITANQNFDRAKNDAYDTALSSAVRSGSDQQQRLFDQSVQQGAFANAAAQQQDARNMGMADFSNTAAGQAFGQNQSAAGFNNTAAAQQEQRNMGLANFGNAGKQANFGNVAYAQNQPIQQFQALLGTGQLQMPTAYSGPTVGVNGTDVLGSYALYDQGRQNNYNQKMANARATNQAIGGLGGAVLGNWGSIFGGGAAKG